MTEALKGAALGRYIAKANNLQTRYAQSSVPVPKPDKKGDARGKEYDWNFYLKLSNVAETIKALFVDGSISAKHPYELNQIYIDTVWTVSFMIRKNLFWGNPDVVRDVRKKKLERAPLVKGNMTYSFPIQKDLLELWLVVLNMLDLIKRFVTPEYADAPFSVTTTTVWLYLFSWARNHRLSTGQSCNEC